MTQIEQTGGKNRRRHMGSGLAGVRPEKMQLGTVDHQERTTPYSILDQIAAQSNRMVRTEQHTPGTERPKNNWIRR